MQLRSRSLLLSLLLSIAPLLAPALVRGEDLGPTSGERLLDEAVEITRRNWYDRENRDRLDWKGLKERYRADAARAETPLEAHHVVNRLLGELKTSHLALMEGSVYTRELDSEFKGKPTLRAGLELVALSDGYFVGSVLEASPAEKAGLKVGDQVLTVNGTKTGDSTLLQDGGHDPGLTLPPSFVLNMVESQTPEPLTLEIRRSAQGKLEKITFQPAPISMLDATRSSVRVIEKDGKKLGVVHLWHFMSPDMGAVLKAAIKGPFAKLDGIVLDVRGRGGRSDVIWQVMGNFQGENATWKKPVVVLQDHGSRSAKEIFVWAWKKRKIGPTVGETTLGAVIGCGFKKLFDGSVLMYPMQDVRGMTKGENLEGHGVTPDVSVEQGKLEFRDGRDAILDRGVSVLLGEIKARAALRYF
jgi:carboxyl-terminal processing protease